MLGLGFRSNYLDLATYYKFILILELKEDDTAKGVGELNYKPRDTNHEDDPNWFDIVKILNIKIPIVVLRR